MRRVGRTVAALTVLVSVFVIAPAALAQNLLNCGDFPFQAAAQAHLRADPGDSSLLDENSNGNACEDYPYPPKSPREEGPVTPPQQTQMVEQVVTEEMPNLPESGGPAAESMTLHSVTLLSGLLLLGVGIVLSRYARVLKHSK